VTTGYYHALPLRKVITELKYAGITATADDLEQYLLQVLEKRTLPFPWEHEQHVVIQPMPLVPERERERGFNQAAWIADRFKRTWLQHVPVINVLERVSSPIPQATLEDKSLRSANVHGEFLSPMPVRGSIILVDDVVTTGSTASDAARALILAGAYNVYLLTLALGK
jgi:ComF family protein